MPLTRVEKERILDSRLKIQSAADALSDIHPDKVPHYSDIQECLESADRNLGGALREADNR